jgi:hypothetical protein
MFKKGLLAVWNFLSKKFWNFVLPKTSINEIEVRSVLVKPEIKDVVNTTKSLKPKPKKKYYKPKPKADNKK